MFIKLQYTADTRITVPLRTLKEIINNSAITSVSSLQSAWTTWDTGLKANFDTANSNIVRTNSPTSTVAHFCVNPSASYSYLTYGEFAFTIEQATYDASSSKIYTQLSSATTTQTVLLNIGSAITGGTIASASAAVTVSESASSTGYGTSLTVGGNTLGSGNALLTSGSGFSNVRTFWAYVTDRCFFFATTNGTTYNSGWGTTYNDSTKFGGPFFQTQYTRYDYHNLDSNGIVPVIYTSPRGTGIGYGTTNDLTTVQNILYTTNTTTVPIRAHSIVSALPQVGSAWPKIYNPYVNMTYASRSTQSYAANQIQVIGTTTSSTLPSYAGGISTAASTRYPNATLTATGFGLMPFGWEANYYGNHGGNASEQCGVYIFNGDYVPGDTFTYNNKVYMIWPMTSGYSNRVGFAVPME